MVKKESFRDFTLFELTHLNIYNMLVLSGSVAGLSTPGNARILGTVLGAMEEIEAKLEAGKKAIEEHTKPEDLIMLETPNEVTLQEAVKHLELSGIQGVREFWEHGLKQHFNFYHELAKYARRKGRKVESLEPGFARVGSRVVTAYAKGNLHGVKKLKLDYILDVRRNKFMHRRIQDGKPKLAIAAEGHVAYLEEKMKPKKVIYYNPGAHKFKSKYLEGLKETERRYRKLREQETKGKKTMRKKKITKRKPR